MSTVVRPRSIWDSDITRALAAHRDSIYQLFPTAPLFFSCRHSLVHLLFRLRHPRPSSPVSCWVLRRSIDACGVHTAVSQQQRSSSLFLSCPLSLHHRRRRIPPFNPSSCSCSCPPLVPPIVVRRGGCGRWSGVVGPAVGAHRCRGAFNPPASPVFARSHCVCEISFPHLQSKAAALHSASRLLSSSSSSTHIVCRRRSVDLPLRSIRGHLRTAGDIALSPRRPATPPVDDDAHFPPDARSQDHRTLRVHTVRPSSTIGRRGWSTACRQNLFRKHTHHWTTQHESISKR
jgi:hypothetical protein